MLKCRPIETELLLQELLIRWAHHRIMIRWVSRFFNHLDRSGLSLALLAMSQSDLLISWGQDFCLHLAEGEIQHDLMHIMLAVYCPV